MALIIGGETRIRPILEDIARYCGIPVPGYDYRTRMGDNNWIGLTSVYTARVESTRMVSPRIGEPKTEELTILGTGTAISAGAGNLDVYFIMEVFGGEVTRFRCAPPLTFEQAQFYGLA